MKIGILCMLLLAGCAWVELEGSGLSMYEYRLTWMCQSAEGCERTAEVERIDRMECIGFTCYFRSTQDESFEEEAQIIGSSGLPTGCSWLYFISLLGHDLERSRRCSTPAGIELLLSIPNEDPTTHSMWLVDGRLAGL
jgi:hypothetical protein